MAEKIVDNLFAPQGGWVVRVIDLSDDSDDNMVEEVKGFLTLMQANEYARRYVRDSIERCRTPRADAETVLGMWRSFGEDAYAVDAGDDAWRAEAELHDFASKRATDEERNWRALDPRGDVGAADEEAEEMPFDDIDDGENDEEYS
jgi:hypothetical protein